MSAATIPYGHQWIDDDDIDAVLDVLRSNWLTTGSKVDEFERAFAEFVGVREAVAVSSGTAALHAVMHTIGVGPGDEVIVPAMTFAASANCVLYQGGTPVFADVCCDTLLIDPAQVQARIAERTKAVVAVDYAGHPCDYDALRSVTEPHGLLLVADSCHALGGSYNGRHVGSLADLSTFSFHPVKHITIGEGGMIATDDVELAHRMRTFRNHGVTTDHRQREQQGSWFYEMVDLGYNCRMTDIHAALGLCQLTRVDEFVAERHALARRYDELLVDLPVKTPWQHPDSYSGLHLYVVRVDLERTASSHLEVFKSLRAAGIGVNLHYMPVYRQPYYARMGFQRALFPESEQYYAEAISLPMSPGLTEEQQYFVVSVLEAAL